MHIEYKLDESKRLDEQEFVIDVSVLTTNEYRESEIKSAEDKEFYNGAKLMANDLIEGLKGDLDFCIHDELPTVKAIYDEYNKEIVMPEIKNRALGTLAEMLISILDNQVCEEEEEE